VDAFRAGASIIGSGGIRPAREELADLLAGDSATVEADGDAGPSTLVGVAVGAVTIGMAGGASNDVSLAEADMQREVCIPCRFICFGLACLICFHFRKIYTSASFP
jgi:hypothetical protein